MQARLFSLLRFAVRKSSEGKLSGLVSCCHVCQLEGAPDSMLVFSSVRPQGEEYQLTV